MTDYCISLTGIHSRNEKTIQATQDWERRRIDEATLERSFDEDCTSVVQLQDSLGFTHLTDGQLTLAWQDLFRPVSSGFEGVHPGAMVRWFNTNTFFFTPTVTGEISSSGRALSRALERKALGRKKNIKFILPDPLTFAELSDDSHYKDKAKLQFAYADALNPELKSLQKLGVRYVQFSSPSLVLRLRSRNVSKSGLEQLGESIRTALRGITARTGFYAYFGDASPYLPDLFDVIPTDDVGIDLTQTDDSSLVKTKKGIIAGAVDSRTTYLEAPGSLFERIEDVVERTGTPSLTLAPSADLRYIPRNAADKKLQLLKEVKELLEE